MSISINIFEIALVLNFLWKIYDSEQNNLPEHKVGQIT